MSGSRVPGTLNVDHMREARGRVGGPVGGPDPDPENHKNIGSLSNTCPDPLKIHKATKPVFIIENWTIIGPPAKSHFNGVFRWRADDGLVSRCIWILSPLNIVRVGSFWICTWITPIY